MIIRAFSLFFVFIFGGLALSACTTAKLEARLEANPQCKEVINPKTGALMPCPGTDRAFYRAAGLEPAKPAAPASTQAESSPNSVSGAVSSVSSTNVGQANVTQASVARGSVPAKNDCKPTIHNKTGGLMPCLPPD